MDAQEQLEKIKLQNRARSKKYYDANRAKILELKQIERDNAKLVNSPVETDTMVVNVEEESIKDKLVRLNLSKAYLGPYNQLVEILGKDISFKFPKRVIKKIDEAQKKFSEELYSINSKKLMLQTILKLIGVLDLKLPLKTTQQYLDKFNELKIASQIQTEDKQETDVIMDFDEYLKQIKEHYGEVSKEYVIASLYSIFSFRDDLQLKIVGDIEEAIDDKINYLVLTTGKAKIVLNSYKTDTKYGQHIIQLPTKISNLVKKYVIENKHRAGDYLLGDGLLSKFISQMNNSIGLPITINNLRQMRISKNASRDPKKLLGLAKTACHSASTSKNYLRSIVKDV
jgi:hypothetical protein